MMTRRRSIMDILRPIRISVISLLGKWWVPDDRRGAQLVLKLLQEEGRAHWKGYATAVAFMAVTAGCTTLLVYLAGQATNYAYINRSFADVAFVAFAAMIISAVKGLSTYGQAVTMAKLSYRVTAESQRRLFEALIRQPVSYF